MKSPLAATLLIGVAELWLFVTVTTCTALVLPTEIVPKEIVAGDRVTGSTPFPVTSCTWVLIEPLSTMVMPPMEVPVTSGVNVTVIVHVLPELSVPLQGVVPLGVTE
jgi:hypothetical protein